MHSFFTYSSRDHRDLHSFPTRRSSDLNQARRPTYAKTRANSASIRNEPLASIIAARLENGGRRHQTGFDRRPDPFSALGDRKSTRLNSSHMSISYAVFCLKKKIRYSDT